MSDFLCFSPFDHPRIRYVFDWIFKERWNKNYSFTSNQDTYRNWTGPKLCYSSTTPNSGLWLPMSSVSIHEQNIGYVPEVQVKSGLCQLFPVQTQSFIDFDLPASVFWMISRFEEYGDAPRDAHGRFPASASLAYEKGFLQAPVVDQWINQLQKALINEYPTLNFPPITSIWQPTYDIDFAWRYRFKPWSSQIRTLGGDVIREGYDVFLKGLKVVAGASRDPYDIYDDLASQNPILFFPLGDHSAFDRNHHWKQPAYRSLIRKWADAGQAGIHPSYASSTDSMVLAEEIRRFQDITGSLPIRSRQHYLRMSLPDTYRNLVDAGVTSDWSMGYADAPGFRAGTAYSFPWYDLQLEKMTSLIIYPFQVMDVTLNHYLQLTPEQARDTIKQLYHPIQLTGGTFVTLWHNNAVACVDKQWRGWESVVPKNL